MGTLNLRNELDILRKLDHPNVIKLYEVYETPNYIFFIMELIIGGDIISAIKN